MCTATSWLLSENSRPCSRATNSSCVDGSSSSDPTSAYIVMAKIVMAYIVMAFLRSKIGTRCRYRRFRWSGLWLMSDLHSYGLYSYGLYSYGQHSYGLYTQGLLISHLGYLQHVCTDASEQIHAETDSCRNVHRRACTHMQAHMKTRAQTCV